MDNWLSELETARFIFVTGKGGTGKSTVAAALAMRLASRGRRILLTEMGRSRDHAFMRLHEILGTDGLDHAPRSVANPLAPAHPLFASRLLPNDAMIEYVGMKLHSPTFAELVLRNRVTATFLDTVPGLAELVCLGKLWHVLEDLPRNAPERVDTVVLDAPASGHALALLHTPKNFARLAKTGPLYADAKVLAKFFSDAKKARIVFVSLPEEIPFAETTDFVAQARGDFPTPLLLVNKCYPLAFPELGTEATQTLPPLEAPPAALRSAWEYSRARLLAERAEMDQYRKKFHDARFLPFLFPAGNAPERELVTALARTWGNVP